MAPIPRTLFSAVTFANTIDPDKGGQYGIHIKCNPTGKKELHNTSDIYGILNDNISFNVTATWDVIGLDNLITSVVGSNPILEGINGVINVGNELGGRSFENTGLFTRLFYKNSGYLEIMPKMRVFDFNNNGLPLQAAMIFASLCIPKQADSLFTINMTKEQIDNAGSRVGGTARDLLTPLIGEKNAATAGYGLNNLTTGAANGINGTTINWSNSPDTIDVEIGNWLTLTDMVLINVTTNFSYEMTAAGPLYADFQLSLKSREALMLDKNGELSQARINGGMNVGNRVSFSSTNGFQGVGDGTYSGTFNKLPPPSPVKNDSLEVAPKAPSTPASPATKSNPMSSAISFGSGYGAMGNTNGPVKVKLVDGKWVQR